MLLRGNSDQNFCRNEAPAASRGPTRSDQLSSRATSSVCPACMMPYPTSDFCQHCSKVICPMCTRLHKAKVLLSLEQKLAVLRTARNQFTSLKATLLKLRSNQASCKKNLAREVVGATDELHCQAVSAFEKAELTIISTSVVKQELLENLGTELMIWGGKLFNHLQISNDVWLDDNAVRVKEFWLITTTIMENANRLADETNFGDEHLFLNLRLSPELEEIRLELEDFPLFVSDSTGLPTSGKS
ncbi:hypothetical protein SprV_0200964100 [Sparganum proliferum]